MAARKSKDLRSVRPTSVAAANKMDNYQPWEIDTPAGWVGQKMCCGKFGGEWGPKIGIGCGNTKEDLLLISSCLGTLWGFIFGYFGLLLKGALDTDETHTLLWVFFWIGLFFFTFVGASVVTGQVQRETAEEAAAKLDELKMQVQAAKEAGFI